MMSLREVGVELPGLWGVPCPGVPCVDLGVAGESNPGLGEAVFLGVGIPVSRAVRLLSRSRSRLLGLVTDCDRERPLGGTATASSDQVAKTAKSDTEVLEGTAPRRGDKGLGNATLCVLSRRTVVRARRGAPRVLD